jgi:hypothetical protein
VSVVSENNVGLAFVSSGRGLLLCARYYCSFRPPVDATGNCRGLLEREGATPRTFWAAQSRKSGVAPARFCISNYVTLIPSSPTRGGLSKTFGTREVKLLSKTNVKSVNSPFFTALPLTVSMLSSSVSLQGVNCSANC